MPWDRKRDEKKSDRPPYELCARWWKMLLKIISIWKKYLSLFMEGYEIMDCDKFSPYVKCIQNVWKKWLSSYAKALNASLKPSLPLHPVGFLKKKCFGDIFAMVKGFFNQTDWLSKVKCHARTTSFYFWSKHHCLRILLYYKEPLLAEHV